MKRSNIFMVQALVLVCMLASPAWALAQARERTQRTSGAFQASSLYDYEVVNRNNETVGAIADFVVSPQGRIKYIFLTPSSWWGSTDRLYVIPWTSFTLNRDKDALVLHLPQERLQNAPSFTRNNWPNMARANWDASFQQYYRQQMAQEQEQRQQDQQMMQGQERQQDQQMGQRQERQQDQQMAQRQERQQDQQRMQSQPRAQSMEQQQRTRQQADQARRQAPESVSETTVMFNFGQTQLTQDARAALDRLVEQLRNTDFATIHLTGHADRVGSDEANFALARRRATRVAAYLAQQGIDATKIRILSLGEEVPAAAGQGEGRLAQDRRVDIAVLQPRTATATRMEDSGTGMQRSRQRAASRPEARGNEQLSATVVDVGRDQGTVTVMTEYGDDIELQASDALLESLTEGDSVEVRLQKLGRTPQSRARQTGDSSEQQSR